MCHRYAVGLSANISTASVFLITACSVFLVYQILIAIGEETLNKQIIFFNAQNEITVFLKKPLSRF